MKTSPALFYTSNKKYVIGTTDDAKQNAITNGYTVFQGMPSWTKKNLSTAIEILARRITAQGNKYYTILPFYKDIKQPNGEYKYTFIKNLTIN